MKRQQITNRAAFLLNFHAKSVTPSLCKKFLKLIPKNNFYCSNNFKEAERHVQEILDKRYSYIFCGGGDGTIVSTINLVHEMSQNLPTNQLPKIGVLRLGTGNALARLLGAKDPEEDINSILSGKAIRPVAVDMIESDFGQLTPFAGIGYDGELLNDFESVKEVFFDSPFRRFFSSVLGFTIAGLFKTLPRQINKNSPQVRIFTKSPGYRIVQVGNKDQEIFLDYQKFLFDDKAPLICVGTVRQLGYGISMFPFAEKRPGYMHLRISAVPLGVCIKNIYPGIWSGSFRHPQLYDFLVKDVTIESDQSLPYQLAGDAMGYKKKISFRVSPKPIMMASIRSYKTTIRLDSDPLMTPLL